MIVTCPNCGARYRLSPEVVARRARLKCAACDHRWVPEVAAETAEIMPATLPPEVAQPECDAPQRPIPLPSPPEPVEATEAAGQPDTAVTADTDSDDPEDEEPRSRPVRTLVAVILGLALAVTAAGLWIGRIDAPGNLGRIPVVGETLASLAPTGPALKITVNGVASALPSGNNVLEITGTITNPGARAARVPLLKASLIGPAGAVRRWTISPPVTVLAPGASAPFSSTVMGFPPEARTLAVTPSR